MVNPALNSPYCQIIKINKEKTSEYFSIVKTWLSRLKAVGGQK